MLDCRWLSGCDGLEGPMVCCEGPLVGGAGFGELGPLMNPLAQRFDFAFAKAIALGGHPKVGVSAGDKLIEETT